jgi:hypothetical protein
MRPLTGFTGQSERQVIASFLCQNRILPCSFVVELCCPVRARHNMVFMVDTVLRLLENRA